MCRKVFVGGIISLFTFFVLFLSFVGDGNCAQEEIKDKKTLVVKGVVSEIAEDSSYITVEAGADKTKFITTKEFLEESYMEVGDKVEIYGEETAQGISLLDYVYDFGFEEEESDLNSSPDVQPADYIAYEGDPSQE